MTVFTFEFPEFKGHPFFSLLGLTALHLTAKHTQPVYTDMLSHTHTHRYKRTLTSTLLHMLTLYPISPFHKWYFSERDLIVLLTHLFHSLIRTQ